MIQSNLPAFQVVFPLIAAPFCAVMPWKKLSWFLASAISLITFIIALSICYYVVHNGPIYYVMGGWEAPFGIEYRVDLLNALMLVMVSAIGALTSVYSYNSVDSEIESARQPSFYCLFLLCLAGLLGMLITNDIFNIYVFLEISSLASYALISLGKDRRALVAAFEYLILGTIGATLILLSIGLIYSMTGTLNISDISVRLPGLSNTLTIKAAMALFVMGLSLKMAVFPLHMWMTKSYTHAPSVITAFLAGTASKVAVYLFIRVLFTIFGYKFLPIYISEILIILALFSIVVGSLVAVYQDNVKTMLAYSSVANIGYIVLAIAIANRSGISAAVLTLFAHSFAKSALFMAVGCVAIKTGGVNIKNFKGIAAKMPFTMAAFLLAGLSLIGVPGTAGFLGKWSMLQALFEKNMWPVFVVVIFSSLLSIVYIWRIIEVAYFKDNFDEVEKISEAPFAMIMSLWVLVGASLFFGIYTKPLLIFSEGISKFLFNL